MINKVAGKNKTESQNLQHKRKLKKKHKICKSNTKLTNTNLIKFVFLSWMVHKETLIDFWKLN